jgi:signal transduction histidine kinase
VHDALVQNSNLSSAERGDGDLARVSRLIVAGELVASVAHDLRQPVTATEMNVSAALRLLTLCLDNPSSQSAKSALEEIGDALRDALAEQGRMRSSLQVLEDLVRHRQPVFTSVDVTALLQEAVQLVRSELSARHIAVDVQLRSAIPHITADALLLRQAILNVIINALDGTSASDHPGGPITIAVSADDAAVELAVTHFGPREPTATPDADLALARSIAEVHGASITTSGTPESGVTISSNWPVQRAASSDAPADERYI